MFAEPLETVDARISNPSDPGVSIGVASATAQITDNDGTPALTVDVVATSISEFGGPAATTVTITRNTDTTDPMDVALTSSDTTEASIQATATIPAGQSTVTVDLDAVDDLLIDGNQTVTITASALDSGGAVGLDASFGTGGLATTQLEMSLQPPQNAIGLQADGKIVSASEGAATNEIKLTRHNPDGTLDTTFGTNGLTVSSFGIGQPVPHKIVFQADGKILVGGRFSTPTRKPFLSSLQRRRDVGHDLRLRRPGQSPRSNEHGQHVD